MRTENAHPFAHRPEWYSGCAFSPLQYIYYGAGNNAHRLYVREAVRIVLFLRWGRCAFSPVPQSPRAQLGHLMTTADQLFLIWGMSVLEKAWNT